MLLFAYIKRGFYILRNDGIKDFINQFIAYMISLFYRHKLYYLYQIDLDQITGENNIIIKDYEIQIIQNVKEFRSLIANSYNFCDMIFEYRLKKGAMAFCLFNSNKEISHVTWVAFDKEAKKDIDYLPYNVNFSEGEVCSGAAYTNPLDRGKGLAKYVQIMLFSFLRSKGIKKVLLTTEVGNMSSNKSIGFFKPTVIAVLKYTNLLYWTKVKYNEFCL
ncbi:hypothetical protein [Pelotomaculum propionicicum]|uniref:N-acetyltransferase domain-containing protein n=1 Tax=Pelotomaculum propionicicum TaxID=258475 RepID=A0A4Y7RS06_9FIRM|nr:hypothetical protein [Pelotomaculum propionicicum]NMB64004.1 hypothetical protein [Spirochaetota bacterium]TEB11057.1 hypothetical protein Pmgp_01929 [Pelotomaculum propionicicum]